jgi:hypothetical protein
MKFQVKEGKDRLRKKKIRKGTENKVIKKEIIKGIKE